MVDLEHLTAVGDHTLLDNENAEEEMDPQMLEFWRWHAAEELEHKSVAFDVFRAVGGGYVTRMLSVVIAFACLTVPMLRITKGMMDDDPHTPTRSERKAAAAFQRRILRKQAPMLLAYLKPGFHPWQIDDTAMLQRWYRSGSVARAS